MTLTPSQLKLLQSLPRNLAEKPLRGGQMRQDAIDLRMFQLAVIRGMLPHQQTLCLTDTGRQALAAGGER